MIIISWDVGIIHLAYCILNFLFDKKNNRTSVKILDWDEINLIEDDRIKLECCGKMKAKKGETPRICGKNATYYLNMGKLSKSILPNEQIKSENNLQSDLSSTKQNCSIQIYGFCKTHLSQHNDYWSQTNTEMLFKQIIPGHNCNYLKTDGTECGKICKFLFRKCNTKLYYCTTHYKSELKKKIKQYSPQPIKNLIVRKYQTAVLQLNLVKKLDILSKHFAKLKIEEVIIENQPSQKNPKMKSIANTLFDYFMIRGYVDKVHEMDIQLVRFMCPSNKLKVNNNNTIEVFKANKDNKKKYKLTKALGIQYTKQLLGKDIKQLEYLNLYKKKDDMCDAYLQGRYYLEFIRNKQPVKLKKQLGGNKTTKKIKEMEKLQCGKKIKKKINKSITNSGSKMNRNNNGRKLKKNMVKEVDIITL